MQFNVPPDLETLIKKRLSSGAYSNAEDVLRSALEAQDAEESWTGYFLSLLRSWVHDIKVEFTVSLA